MTAATVCVRTAWVLLAPCLSACAAAPAGPAAVTEVPAAKDLAPATPASGPPPLSERERALLDELRRDVEWVVSELGERSADDEVGLATATDELVRALERSGHTVERQGVVAGDVVTQNLEVVIRGGKQGAEQVVVGAHYDTHVGTPGADDNASGVAAVLALARAFRTARPRRTLRLALFCNEEAPHFQTPSMGSLVYAKRLKEAHANVVAMLSLESIGYYSDAPESQRYPSELSGEYPTTGDFLAVVGSEQHKDVLERVHAAIEQSATLPVIGRALPDSMPGVSASDHWSFWQMGFPAVMVTDTAPFRNPHYHVATDLPATLDFDRYARAVAAIEAGVRQLLGDAEER